MMNSKTTRRQKKAKKFAKYRKGKHLEYQVDRKKRAENNFRKSPLTGEST